MDEKTMAYLERTWQNATRLWNVMRGTLAWAVTHDLVAATSYRLCDMEWLNYGTGRKRTRYLSNEETIIPKPDRSFFHFDHTTRWKQRGTNIRILVTHPYDIVIPHPPVQTVITEPHGHTYRLCWHPRSWYYDGRTTMIVVTQPEESQQFAWNGDVIPEADVEDRWITHLKGHPSLGDAPRKPVPLSVSIAREARRRRTG